MLLNPDPPPFFLFPIVVCSKMQAIHLKRKSKLWRLDIVLHVNCDTCINLELSFLIQIQAYNYNYFLTIIIHDWTLIEYSQQRKKVGKYIFFILIYQTFSRFFFQVKGEGVEPYHKIKPVSQLNLLINLSIVIFYPEHPGLPSRSAHFPYINTQCD